MENNSRGIRHLKTCWYLLIFRESQEYLLWRTFCRLIIKTRICHNLVPNVKDKKGHGRVGSLGLRGRGERGWWPSCPNKFTQCVSVEIGMQTHSNCMKNKNVHNSHIHLNCYNSKNSYAESLHTQWPLSAVSIFVNLCPNFCHFFFQKLLGARTPVPPPPPPPARTLMKKITVKPSKPWRHEVRLECLLRKVKKLSWLPCLQIVNRS